MKDYDEIEIKVKENMLNFITPNLSSDQIMVNYKIGNAQSAYLMIVDYYGNIGTSNNYLLDINTTQTTINISNYHTGFYSVALVCDGQIVDAKTLIKN